MLGPGRQAPRWKPATLRFLKGLETTLSTIPTEDVLARIEAADLRPDPAGIREILSLALEAREECQIQYLKPGDEAPEDRTVRPYTMVHGEGAWYFLAWCTVSEGVRTFRFDRVLNAEPTGERFAAPGDFDPGAHVQGGRVFQADKKMEVKVRYSAKVARWIAEREALESSDDGSVTVTYQVADPHWIVRHVLSYGAEAEVLEPEVVRGWVGGGWPPGWVTLIDRPHHGQKRTIRLLFPFSAPFPASDSTRVKRPRTAARDPRFPNPHALRQTPAQPRRTMSRKGVVWRPLLDHRGRCARPPAAARAAV